jgi:hypothetical protein
MSVSRVVGGLPVGPGKGVAKGCLLAGLQLLKADDIVGQQTFVLKGQTHVVQPGVVGADGDVYPSFKAAIEHDFELINFV